MPENKYFSPDPRLLFIFYAISTSPTLYTPNERFFLCTPFPFILSLNSFFSLTFFRLDFVFFHPSTLSTFSDSRLSRRAIFQFPSPHRRPLLLSLILSFIPFPLFKSTENQRERKMSQEKFETGGWHAVVYTYYSRRIIRELS